MTNKCISIAKKIDWSSERLNFHLEQQDNARFIKLVGDMGKISSNEVDMSLISDNILQVSIVHLPKDEDINDLAKKAAEVLMVKECIKLFNYFFR